MYITLNLVLESLKPYAFRDHIGSGDLRFERLCLLPEEGADIDPEWLYVGGLADALALRSKGERFFCVCTGDEDGGPESDLSGFIVVSGDISQYQVFSGLQDLFYRINEWTDRMHRCVYEKRPPQDVLDLSEPVIGNFISVSDSALSLVCCTRNIATDDPVSMELVRNGFHPEKTVEIFRKDGLFERWEKESGIIINKSHSFSPYDICSRVFKLFNAYYIHAVMTCDHRPLTPGLIDLFRMLTDVLEIYVSHDWKENAFIRHDYDRFLIKMIEGRAGTAGVIENTAGRHDLPMRSLYQLCLIDPRADDNLPLGRFGLELSWKFSEARVTVYQNRIIMLFNDRAENEEAILPEAKLKEWLEVNNAACAVSSCFTLLTDISAAYEQTQMIFRHFPSLQKLPFPKDPDKTRIIYFNNCFQPLMLAENPNSLNMWRMTRCYRMLKKLSEYDKKHDTDNIRLLYIYLFCDCSASETGAVIHMHRNNVLYRIGRIEEIMGTKLSDQKIRYELFCGCSFLQLYGI